MAVNLRMLEELGRWGYSCKKRRGEGAVTRARQLSFWRKWRTAIRGIIDSCHGFP